MKILLVANFSTLRCGFRNYADQMYRALVRAGATVDSFDGTYPLVYDRIQQGFGQGAYLPDVAAYDVVHLIWHPATMNHYSGAEFPPGPLYSFWNGHPFAGCPFLDKFALKWTPIRDGEATDHLEHFYPIVDWIDDLPEPNADFTVGLTGVRREGFEEVAEICEREGWQVNAGDPTTWIPLEDEIRRLARSSVNVNWYSPKHPDRSGGVMTALASKRPQIVTEVPMFDHLRDAAGERMSDLIWGVHPDQVEMSSIEHACRNLRASLRLAYLAWTEGVLDRPLATVERFSWSRAAEIFLDTWLQYMGPSL